MTETSRQRIQSLEQQIRDLEEAIELVCNPPKVKIDESAYSALNEVRGYFAEAKSQQESRQRLKLLQDQIVSQKAELVGLKADLSKCQAAVEALKEPQRQAFEQYQRLMAEALKSLKVAVGYAQLMKQRSAELSPSHGGTGVSHSTKSTITKATLNEHGAISWTLEACDFLESASGEWGERHYYFKDFSSLVELKTEDAA